MIVVTLHMVQHSVVTFTKRRRTQAQIQKKKADDVFDDHVNLHAIQLQLQYWIDIQLYLFINS